MRFDVPGAEFPVLATAIFAEVLSVFPMPMRKALGLTILKAIMASHHRWVTGTINEGPSLTKLLGKDGFNKEELAAFLRESVGEEGAEIFKKVMEIFT